MIKVILFDIDGTLFTDQATVQQSTKKAITLAQAKGILCGVATGRGPTQLGPEIEQLGLDVFITYNGQYIYTKKQVIRSKAIPKDVINELIFFAEKNQRDIVFGSHDSMEGSSLLQFGQKKWVQWLVKMIPKWVQTKILKKITYKVSRGKKNKSYQGLDILSKKIYQCVMISPESETEVLQNRFSECTLTRSNPYTVDILTKGGSKLEGIQSFVTSYGLSLDEVMAFGDNLNDIEMLQGVGIGIAMGNGEEATKEVAQYVSTSNNEDGIYRALQKYAIVT